MKLELTKNNPDFDGLKWIALALNKDKQELRVFKNNIYIINGVAVATDGARLHEYTLDGGYEFKDGFYEVLQNNKTKLALLRINDSDDHEFPDYNEIIESVIGDDLILVEGIERAADHNFCTIIRANANNFQFSFIRDATVGCNKVITGKGIDENNEPDSRAIKCVGDGRIAIIMPVIK